MDSPRRSLRWQLPRIIEVLSLGVRGYSTASDPFGAPAVPLDHPEALGMVAGGTERDRTCREP